MDMKEDFNHSRGRVGFNYTQLKQVTRSRTLEEEDNGVVISGQHSILFHH